ncbi:DUF938 domain-containing protein [Burkholderia perseverans]|uniref:DUF938 domain-containing protein n=1 Tax=Burkholderia perseverans TaxID=2615214 RepID=UPI001FF07C36|nr:DUF938 domain-containing protein [Burkholderia perseverans]
MTTPNPSAATPNPASPTGAERSSLRLHAPAAERNREPILAVLREVLPEAGTVLEIASGTGQHAEYFAAALPQLVWQPTDPDPQALASIAVRVADAALPNLRAPLPLDVRAERWPLDGTSGLDAVVCINMIHISPWEAGRALIDGVAQRLNPGGVLVLYGPYRRNGAHTAPSNEAFDAQLRQRDAAWGVRDLEAVDALAQAAGFDAAQVVEMPANNLCVVFRRRAR